MTILWCGGEDVDLIAPYNNDGYDYDSNLSRCSLMSGKTVTFDSVTSCWVHARITMGIGRYGSISIADYVTGYGIKVTVASGYCNIVKHGPSDVTLFSENATVEGSDIDFQLISYGSSATLNLYIGGELVTTYSGDITIPDISGFNCLVLSCDSYTAFAEIIVADEDTRLMRLKTLAPSAAGDTNTWTGAYTDVDETTLSDSDKITSATDNADFQCNLTGMPTGTWSIKAVKVAARCVDGSGSTGIQLGVKSGGTVGSGDTQTASGYWQTKERLMQVNPVTGVAFTPAEIEALQINLRAKAL